MFGYVTIYRKGLDDAATDRYQAYYCGLCRRLGHGPLAEEEVITVRFRLTEISRCGMINTLRSTK